MVDGELVSNACKVEVWAAKVMRLKPSNHFTFENKANQLFPKRQFIIFNHSTKGKVRPDTLCILWLCPGTHTTEYYFGLFLMCHELMFSTGKLFDLGFTPTSITVMAQTTHRICLFFHHLIQTWFFFRLRPPVSAGRLLGIQAFICVVICAI